MNKRRRGAKHVWVTCAYCEKRFLASTVERRRGNGRCCSRSCAASKGNTTTRRTGKRIYSYVESKRRYGLTFVSNQIVMRVRSRAREAGLPCDLTPSMFREMYAKQQGRCAYTGAKMRIGENTRTEMSADSISLDRIQPKLGYVSGNLNLCCRWVNSAKGQGTLSELVAGAKQLVAVSG